MDLENNSRPQLRHSVSYITLDFEDKEEIWWPDRLVIPYKNRFRNFWDFILALLLIYSGTIFPYRVCFIQLRVLVDTDEMPAEDSVGWDIIEQVVDYAFILDFILGFFLSYRDECDVEILSLKRIVQHYLRTYFLINLVACLPKQTFDNIGEAELHKASRITRLPRISRLLRLFRLIRLVKVYTALKKGQLLRWFDGMRGLRVINFLGCLAWFVHLLACGWYLCAALYPDPRSTWVWRRQINAFGERLTSADAGEQWMNGMYFILTLFTTVGFGDIIAQSDVEILYAIFVMVVGAIVNSIIISEVISTLWREDAGQEAKRKRKVLLEAFGRHVGLDADFLQKMIFWSETEKNSMGHFNREDMWKLMMNSSLPSELLEKMPRHIFKGQLLKNKFVSMCAFRCSHNVVPARFSTLLATLVSHKYFQNGDMVFQMNEHPFNLFLVLSGTFAYVGKPTMGGGQDDMFRFDTGALTEQRRPFLTLPTMTVLPTLTRADTRDLKSPRKRGNELYPYQLFSVGNYFGDVEMIYTRRMPRMQSARCEAAGGALVLHSNDLRLLMEEFPHFATVWQAAANRRAERREKCLAKHRPPGLSYRVFAVVKIQQYFRKLHGTFLPLPDIQQRRSVNLRRWREKSMKENNQLAHIDALRALREEMQKLTDECSVVDTLRVEVYELRKQVRDALNLIEHRRSPESAAEVCNTVMDL